MKITSKYSSTQIMWQHWFHGHIENPCVYAWSKGIYKDDGSGGGANDDDNNNYTQSTKMQLSDQLFIGV